MSPSSPMQPGVAVAELSEDARRLLCVIAHHPGDFFAAGAVFAACGLGRSAAAIALDVLVGLGVIVAVEASSGPSLYRTNSDRRDEWVAGVTDVLDPVGVCRGLGDWYLRVAQAGSLAINPDRCRPYAYPAVWQVFGSAEEALRWLGDQIRLLHAVQMRIAADGWLTGGWRLADALADAVARARVDCGMAIRIAEVGLGCARDDGDQRAQACLRIQLAEAYLGTDVQAARAQLTAAVECARRAGDRVLEIGAVEVLGVLAEEVMGEFELACVYYRRATELAAELGECAWPVMLLCPARYGRLLLELGRHAEALTPLRAVLAGAKKLNDPALSALIAARLAEAHAHLGDREEALSLLADAGDAVALVDAPDVLAQVLDHLARAHAAWGDPTATAPESSAASGGERD